MLQAKIERENNFKEFKSANDMELQPKFGAGSEFGREQREEARKKKLGMRIRKYNIEDQPYLLKLGGGKQIRRWFSKRVCAIAFIPCQVGWFGDESSGYIWCGMK